MSIGIFTEYEGCLEDRGKLRGVLLDVFLGERSQANIILAAYDMGIMEIIQNARVLDDIFKGKCCKRLEGEFGLSTENAEKAVQFWIEEYGEGYLGKTNSCSFNEEDYVYVEELPTESVRRSQGRKRKSRSPIPSHPVVSPAQNHQAFDVKDLSKGDRLPKELLCRDAALEKGFGVDDLHASFFKGDRDGNSIEIRVVGELTGNAKSKRDMLIVIVIHNDQGEPIGMSADIVLEAGQLNGSYSFEEEVSIPVDEFISGITVKIAYSPAYIDWDD